MVIVDYPINVAADVGAEKYIRALLKIIADRGMDFEFHSIYSELSKKSALLEIVNLVFRLQPIQITRRSAIKKRKTPGKLIIYGLDNYEIAQEPGKAILIAGDSMSRLKESLAKNTRGIFYRLYHYISAYAYARLERRVYSRFEKVYFVSPEDLLHVQKLTGASNLFVSEIFLTDEDFSAGPRPAYLPDRYIVFTGNMNYPPNRDAALNLCSRYLSECNSDTNFDLVLAGLGSDNLAPKHPRIHALGRVDDIKSVILNAICYVSLLSAGSGLKNKVLETFALSTPLIATPKTVEGFIGLSRGDHYLEYSESLTLAEQIQYCERQATMLSRNALVYALQYTPERSLAKIIN